MILALFRSRLASISIVLLATIVLVFTFSRSTHFLRASLLDDQVLVLSDTDHDGIFSVREMRKAIVKMIQASIVQNTTYDLNTDGVTDRNDLTLLIQSIRDYLSAVCGNGIVQAGEKCDDGNTSNSDFCTNTCKLAACGDGFLQNAEQCDDGNATNNDGCAAVLCTVESGATCVGTPSICKNLATNLDAYWKFDETAGVRVSSVGSYPLSVFNANIGSAQGKIGNALAPNIFYGLTNANTVLPNANRNFSIAAWVYLSTIPHNNSIAVLFSGTDTSGNMTWMLSHRFGATNRFDFSLQNASGTQSVQSNTFGTAPRGVWNYVVATFDVSTKKMSISVNGGQPDVLTLVGAPRGNGNYITVGFDAHRLFGNSNTSSEVSRIDEAGIWNRVLSSEEIVRLYNRGIGRTTPFGDNLCGNSIVTFDEQCDDGNLVGTDLCTNDCRFSNCGDAFVQGAEECDDGNLVSTDFCTGLCKFAACGDGFVQNAEQCDDGNRINTDACSASCAIPLCGNGTVDGVEECDNTTSFCTSVCKLARCGDGSRQNAEQCDDGNTVDTDGCTNACIFRPVCQNGIIEGAEQCDDGNSVDADSCTNTCVIHPICRNGIVEGQEQCDDNNAIDTDACRNNCTLPYCGDGIRNGDDYCDDGNQNDADSCLNSCRRQLCGDGFRDGTEQCDDGNAVSYDGCNNFCQSIVPYGVFCDNRRIAICRNGETPTCPLAYPIFDCRIDLVSNQVTYTPWCCNSGLCGAQPNCSWCGDGRVQSPEECDDGDQIDINGCSNICTSAPTPPPPPPPLPPPLVCGVTMDSAMFPDPLAGDTLQFFLPTPTHLFAGGDTQVYVLKDDRSQWLSAGVREATDNLGVSTQGRTIAPQKLFHDRTNNTLYLMAKDGGIWRQNFTSSGLEGTWHYLGLGNTTGTLNVSPNNTIVMYLGTIYILEGTTIYSYINGSFQTVTPPPGGAKNLVTVSSENTLYSFNNDYLYSFRGAYWDTISLDSSSLFSRSNSVYTQIVGTSSRVYTIRTSGTYIEVLELYPQGKVWQKKADVPLGTRLEKGSDLYIQNGVEHTYAVLPNGVVTLLNTNGGSVYDPRPSTCLSSNAPVSCSAPLVVHVTDWHPNSMWSNNILWVGGEAINASIGGKPYYSCQKLSI